MSDDEAVDEAIARRLAFMGRRWGAVVAAASVTLLIAVAVPLTASRRPLAPPAAAASWRGSFGGAAAAGASPAAATSGSPTQLAAPDAAAAGGRLDVSSSFGAGLTASSPSAPAAPVAPPAAGPAAQAYDEPAPALDDGPSAAPAAPGPVTVAEAGWATAAGSGTPAATAGVPDGGLPVSARLGRTDKYSFLRLAGRGTVLTLTLVPDAGANQFDDQAAVQACPVLDAGWKPGAAQDAATAPRFDPQGCRVATRNGTSFVFDIGGLSGAFGPAGIALVPAPTAGPAFQVVFAH